MGILERVPCQPASRMVEAQKLLKAGPGLVAENVSQLALRHLRREQLLRPGGATKYLYRASIGVGYQWY